MRAVTATSSIPAVSLNGLWAFLAVALPVLASLVASLPATDLAYHLRAGSEILSTRAIPSVDSWTFTAAGLPWFDQQWALSSSDTTYQVSGWGGLAILRAALVGFVFGMVFLLCFRRGLEARRAAMLTLGAFVVAAPALALRPQLIAMALFALRSCSSLNDMSIRGDSGSCRSSRSSGRTCTAVSSWLRQSSGLPGWRTSKPASPSDQVRHRGLRDGARLLRHAVRTGCLGLRRGTRRKPGRHAPD